jgi:hypothetical protein
MLETAEFPGVLATESLDRAKRELVEEPIHRQHDRVT